MEGNTRIFKGPKYQSKYSNPLAGQDYKNGLTKEGDEKYDALLKMAKEGRKNPNRRKVETVMYLLLRKANNIEEGETDGPAWKKARAKKAKRTSTVAALPIAGRDMDIDFGAESDLEDEGIADDVEGDLAAMKAAFLGDGADGAN